VDYLNLPDSDFDHFLNNLIQYAAQKCGGGTPEWTHIPAAARQELADVYAAWHSAYEKTLVPHSRVDTEAKNEAKTAAKEKVRPFVNIYLREDQSAVTDMDRTAMSVPNKDKVPSAHPVPDVKPNTEASPSGKGRHTVRAVNPLTGDHRRPDLVKGVSFAHRKRKPGDPKNAANDMPSEFQTKTTRDFQWAEEDYGMVCDYATAYENEGGKRGPWSDVVSVIIA
jgi:hypothetical protein